MKGDWKGRLDNRVAIVTGGSRGIGRAIAIIFAREGAQVVVNYRQQKGKAQDVVKTIRDRGGRSFACQADVSDRAAVKKMVDKAVDKFGNVDILVNNAGINRQVGVSLIELKDEDIDALLKTNVKGILYCTQAVAFYMMKQESGKIVNISSIAGLGISLRAGNHLYAATKGAVNIMTKRFALELGPYGVRVNAIAPGLIRTDMLLRGRSARELEQWMKNNRENTMLRRIGTPKDIAYTALFLASNESSFLTGQVISVDGGRMNFLSHSL